jgi:hypothetical protein
VSGQQLTVEDIAVAIMTVPPDQAVFVIDNWITSDPNALAQLTEVRSKLVQAGEADLIRWFDENYQTAVQANSDAEQEVRTSTAAYTAMDSDGGMTITPAEEQELRDQGASDEEIVQAQSLAETQPGWVSELARGALSDGQKAEILAGIRAQYGMTFSSWEQAMESGILAQGQLDPVLQQLVVDVVTPFEPRVGFDVPLGNGRSHFVFQDQMEVARDRWGVTPDQVTKMVRIADSYGLYPGESPQYRSDTTWQVVMGLWQANGLLQPWLDATRQAEVNSQFWDSDVGRALSTRTSESPRMLGTPFTTFTTGVPDPSLQKVQSTDPRDRFEASAPQQRVFDMVKNVPVMFGGGRVQKPGMADGMRTGADILREFNTGLKLYNYDPGAAFIHALDPGLAHRFTQGDFALDSTPQEMYQMQSLLSSAGFRDFNDFKGTLLDTGYAEASQMGSGLFDQWSTLQSMAENRGSGSQLLMPDPAGLDEALRDLYQQMYMKEPDEKTMASFRAEINRAVSSAASSGIGSIDVAARARQFARKDGSYDTLYGNRPDGMSEVEYRSMMESGQRSMLGAETGGNVATQAGMRTGKYQTAVGAAAATTEAWDNSTFLGRLARAANIVGVNT